jgi:small subunit ribosomal protein S6
MRPYETLVVLRTDLGEEAAKLLTRFETVIANQGGSIDEKRDWGVRDLAYPIGKQKQGHYHLLEYQAEPQTVKELERNLRIVEGVLRFVSVQQEHTGLPEPRVREEYHRRDTPLHEMRTSGRDEAAGSPGRGEEPAAAEAALEDMSGGAPAEDAGEMQS